ncbi:MAG: pyrroline-5-carboxylate reductase family protein, partial [Rhodocyclaceae bacterium]
SLGLPVKTARLLAIETFLGAAKLAESSDEPVDQLRMRVTSKGGTTAAALEVFDAEALAAIIARGVTAAAARGRELSEILGQD